MNDGAQPEGHAGLIAVDYDPFAGAPPLALPASAFQQELWRSGRLAGEATCANTESLSVGLTGDIKTEVLETALQALTQFHEGLRGHFSEDGKLFVIESQMAVPIARHDISDLPLAERAPAALRLMQASAAEAYDLEEGPLFRASIIRLGTTEWIVVLAAHQAACDGWSMDVVLADLGRLYSGLAGATPLPSPPKHCFSDYVHYRTSQACASRVDSSRGFWRTTFEVAPAPLEFPLEHARPTSRTYGAHHALQPVSANVLADIRRFARSHELSVFSVLFSAFSVFISRISRSQDFVIAVPVAGHPEVGMEDCVGDLVHLVPTRCQCKPQQSFETLCRKNYTSMLDARENAWMSIGEISEELRTSGKTEDAPLAAVVFTHVQKYAPGKLSFAGCSVDYQPAIRAYSEFELSLTVFESHDGMMLHCHGNADLFSQSWLARQLHEFERLLHRACNLPNITIAHLVDVPEHEVAQVDSSLEGKASAYLRALSFGSIIDTAGFVGSGPKAEREGDTDETQAPIIVTLQEGQATKPPLICLFGIQLYLDLALAMDDGTPVVGIHVPMVYVPGKTRRPPLHEVAERYVSAVRTVQASGPYHLAGLCFGGVVAYEVARRLRAQGETVSMVVLLDSLLPRGCQTRQAARIAGVLRRGLRDPREAFQKVLQRLSTQSAPLLVRAPIGKGIIQRFVGRSSGEAPSEPVDLLVDEPEARLDVAKLDASNPYLDARLLVFRATRTDLPPWQVTEPNMGWLGRASSVQAYDVESDHLGIVQRPHAARVAGIIMRELRRHRG